MCGITGYVGNKNASIILIESMKKLEYRGYDSAGVSFLDSKGALNIYKSTGTVNNLNKSLDKCKPNSNAGIGHTRWATHGEPNNINAHPHSDCTGFVSVVHNGIIENYKNLRNVLENLGHKFASQTDSECISHLIEDYLHKTNDIEKAIINTANKIKGNNAVLLIATHYPDNLFCFQIGDISSLTIAQGNNEMFVSSDIVAIPSHVTKVTYLSNNELAVISSNHIQYKDFAGTEIAKPNINVDIDTDTPSKGNFDHFMLKEIYDQPQSIINIINSKVSFTDSKIKFDDIPFTSNQIRQFSRIVLIGMGTSMHAAMVAKYWFELICKIPTEVDNSSEFRYRNVTLDEQTLIISISQSGETADTVAAMKNSKAFGSKQITLSNFQYSQTSRIADYTIELKAGLEIGVASTKTFISSLSNLFLLALFFAAKRKTLTNTEIHSQLSELNTIPMKIDSMLNNRNQYKRISHKYSTKSNFIYLGRGLNYPLAMEGALKLKEVSYIHAEGYPAGEMKHGPIALIDHNMPVVTLIPKDNMMDKMLITLNEVKARKGQVIAITTESERYIETLADDVIYIPKTSDELNPIIISVPMQLLSYYIALENNLNIDMPRNLAKSVTVE